MSPYELSILLHYYAHCDDHPDIHNPPPIWRATMDRFLENGLLETPDDTERIAAYVITERGQVFINAILWTKLPVRRWVMPSVEAEPA